MRILLTNTPLQAKNFIAFASPNMAYSATLTALAAVLAPEHTVRIQDNNWERARPHGVWQAIDEFDPEVVGISIPANPDHEAALELARKVRARRPDVYLVAGGEHASFDWRTMLANGFDYVVIGEGEVTAPALLAHIAAGRGREAPGIPGVAWRRRGEPVANDPRPLIEDLDTLPIPAWDLLPHPPGLMGMPVATLEVSRGCGARCTFCTESAFWGFRLRQKSNERIMRELLALHARGVREVYLLESSFGLDAGKTVDLMREIERRDLGFIFSSMIRPSTAAEHPEMVEAAARAGLRYVIAGFESHRDGTIRGLGKRGQSRDVNRRAQEILRANRVVIRGTYIAGLPGTGFSDLLSLYWHERRHNDIFEMIAFDSRPGSSIHEDLRSRTSRGEAVDLPLARTAMAAARSALFLSHLFNPATVVRQAVFAPDPYYRSVYLHRMAATLQIARLQALTRLGLWRV